MNINGKTTYETLFGNFRPTIESNEGLEIEIPAFLRPGYRGVADPSPTRPVLEATPFEELEIPALLRRGG